MPKKKTIDKLKQLRETHTDRVAKIDLELEKAKSRLKPDKDSIEIGFLCAYARSHLQGLGLDASDLFNEVKNNDGKINKLFRDLVIKCGEQIIESVKENAEFKYEQNILYKFLSGIKEEQCQKWFNEKSAAGYIHNYVKNGLSKEQENRTSQG